MDKKQTEEREEKTMEKDNSKAYSEVIEILKLIEDEQKLEALPLEMLEVLKAKSNPEYKPKISNEMPLDEQNLQPETFSILAWIAMKYWGEEIESETSEKNDNKEKEDMEQNIETTEKIEPEEIPLQEQQANTYNLPVLQKDLKWYQRIKVRILEFFHKIFKRKSKEDIET